MYQKYDIKKLSYYTPNNKIWGWLLYNDPVVTERNLRLRYSYAFWAVAGKTLSFMRHSHWNDNHMNRLLQNKISNKYEEIDNTKLLELWPDFYEQLDQRFVYYQLSNGFEK